MQSIKAILLAALLCSCAGAQDDQSDVYATDSTSDIGQVEQADSYECNNQQFHFFGVQNNDDNFIPNQCNIRSTAHACVFPSFKMYPEPGLKLQQGWSTAERSTFATPGANAATFMTSQFGCLNISGDSSVHFTFSKDTSTFPFAIEFIKAPITATVSNSSNNEPYDRFAHMRCSDQLALTENLPMVSAGRCNHWLVKVDFDKLLVWSQATGLGTAARDRAIQNLVQKSYGIAIGLGVHGTAGGGNSNVMDFTISRTSLQSTFSTANDGEKAWACNAYLSGNNNTTSLSCF